MQRMFKTAAIVGAMATGFSASAQSETEQLRAEMAQMRAEMAQMKAQQEGDWLNEARADEVRALINEVMQDANTRATLLQEGQMAGIDSKGKIFLNSADGDFSLNLSGQLQFRYVFNNVDAGAGVDESTSGFQARRTKVKFAGDVADDWSYTIVFAGDRDGGEIIIEDAIMTYELSDNMTVDFGIMKLPFARQELISSSRQVSADRGLATEYFTLNRSEGVQLTYEMDKVIFTGMVSDGANNSNSDFNSTGGGEAHDFAFTGRVDWMVLGDDWGAAKHAFGQEEQALFLGAAVNYGQLEFGAAGVDTQLNWTIDALYKVANFGIMAAVYGSSSDANPAGADTDALGWYAQVDYKIGETKWDVFARYDYIDDDTADELNAVTVGANYHFNKNVKATGDVIFLLDSDNPDGIGFQNDGEDSDGVGFGVPGFGGGATDTDAVAVRLQLQVLF